MSKFNQIHVVRSSFHLGYRREPSATLDLKSNTKQVVFMPLQVVVVTTLVCHLKEFHVEPYSTFNFVDVKQQIRVKISWRICAYGATTMQKFQLSDLNQRP